jgi:transposase
MTAPYSMDLRERAMARKAAGETNRQIAAALRIAPSCVSKWTRRERETGSLAPAQAVLPEEQTRPDVARRRARWKAYQGRIAPQRLGFIDETWVKTNMAPLRGWDPEGVA